MTTLFSAFPLLMAAPAASSEGATGSMVTTFITFGLIILVFYFLIIRPQKKKEKETKEMIQAIKKGDKIVTIGGIRGTVLSVKDDAVVIKVDDNAKIEFSKGAVSSVISKKEEKSAAPAAKPAANKSTTKKPASSKKADSAKQDETKSNDENDEADSEKTE